MAYMILLRTLWPSKNGISQAWDCFVRHHPTSLAISIRFQELQFFVVELSPYFSFTFLSLLLNLLLIYPLYCVTGNSGINMLFGMLL